LVVVAVVTVVVGHHHRFRPLPPHRSRYCWYRNRCQRWYPKAISARRVRSRQESPDPQPASARMLNARSSSSGMPAQARRKARRSISGSSIASHSHSSRTSGAILGPKYCSRSSDKVGGVKVRQAESMNSVRPSIDAEERERACGPLPPHVLAAVLFVSSRQRCAEREGRMRRQSCSEGGQTDQQEILIVVFGGMLSASKACRHLSTRSWKLRERRVGRGIERVE